MTLEGKVAFVTGASRGIGKGIALQLAKEGAKVACVSSTAGCYATASEAGNSAIAIKCDVADVGEVDEAVAETIARLGGVDILVNNAGITRDQLVIRMSNDDWDAVMNVNLKGAFLCVRAASKPMVKARWGRIINLTSIVGLVGQAGQANYAASKAGLIGFTKSVAKEFGSRGITCNAIAPGFIETDMTAELPQNMREHVHNTAPLGRLGTIQDIASAALFLAGEGSSYITGQVLVVDGGLTL
ncbi:MAG: 3-oxoacyl-[acyl-carrier-protein] reductase [Fimbriimonadales bacterium]